MINPKMLGLLVASFVAGSFIASPELRAYAAATIGSAEIIDGSIQSVDIGNGQVKNADLGADSVTAAKIKNDEVKAAEIATDAVGAAELQGVSKLKFADCLITDNTNVSAFGVVIVNCTLSDIAVSDNVIATLKSGNNCFVISTVHAVSTNTIQLAMANACDHTTTLGTAVFSLVIYLT